MTSDVDEIASRVGPVIDGNVHLWDQTANPVFWLSDRTTLRDMLGDYDSLPDRYTLEDYRRATSAFTVEGIIWSDPGAADPLAAIASVRDQDHAGLVVGIVTLADPLAASFPALVRQVAREPLVSSVRIRLTDDFHPATDADQPSGARLADRLRQLGEAGLVATFEVSADQLGSVLDLATQLPELRIVVDHFGWPSDLTVRGRRAHLAQLTSLAAHDNVATRIDAIGTIFGSWDLESIRPWLEGTVAAFGAERCMLGSDLPIETLRSSFGRLYAAYDDIFATCSGPERHQLFGATAREWLGRAGSG